MTSNIEDMLHYAQMQLDADSPFARCHESLKVINASSESYQMMGISRRNMLSSIIMIM